MSQFISKYRQFIFKGRLIIRHAREGRYICLDQVCDLDRNDENIHVHTVVFNLIQTKCKLKVSSKWTVSYWDFIKSKQIILCRTKFISMNTIYSWFYLLFNKNYQEFFLLSQIQEIWSNMCVCVCLYIKIFTLTIFVFIINSSTNLLQCKHSTRFQNIISFELKLVESCCVV